MLTQLLLDLQTEADKCEKEGSTGFTDILRSAIREIKELQAMTEGQREVITDLEDRLEKAHNTLQQFKQDWAIAWSRTPGYRKPPSKATLDAISIAVNKIVNLDAVGNPLSGCITQFNKNNAASNLQRDALQSISAPADAKEEK